MDPDRFLALHPPFDRLGEDAFDGIRASLEVTWAPRGDTLLRREEGASRYLYVVRKGAVRLERDGRVLQVLEEGEPFGFPSLLSGGNPHADVVAEEDSVLLRLPAEVFHRLMDEAPFADFFVARLSERLRRSADAPERPSLSGDLAVPVGGLVTRPPVFGAPTLTVAEAARRMTGERVSSLLVADGEGEGDGDAGIVTDRDLRRRVLAAGRPAETPVGGVASRPLKSVPADAPVLTALLEMIEARIHHLAVREGGEGGAVVGVVTDTDLLRHHLKSPLALLQRIERAATPGALAGYPEDLTAMVELLHRGGTGAVEIGRIVSTVHDAATARLLRLAEADLGPPPRPYAWIVHGSEGRREQALLTDQDNALVYADGGAEGGGDDAGDAGDEGYFRELARRVVEGLVTLGIPRCAGGFMATGWCLPLAEWRRTFAGWLASPEPEALLDAANFFDFRAIHGGLSTEPLAEVVDDAPDYPTFLAHMAKNALTFQPPLGLFRRIRRREGGVDVKKGGILPIVSLARLWALEARVRERGTLERLAAAAEAGALSPVGAEDLAEALRYLLRQRLEHQLAALRAGGDPGNRIDVGALSPLERRHLKDTFLTIREMQSAVAQRYNLALLG